MTITVMEHSRFFCHMAIPIKLSRSITYFGTAEKVMPYHISPNGSAGGCFSAYAALGRHKPFNLHYFRPYLFWHYLKKSCPLHFPNKAQIVETDMPNRLSALEWERENALRLWNEGNSMSLHKRPRPWEE